MSERIRAAEATASVIADRVSESVDEAVRAMSVASGLPLHKASTIIIGGLVCRYQIEVNELSEEVVACLEAKKETH